MNGMTIARTMTLTKINRVRVTSDTLTVDLEDGRTISVPIGWYPRLAHGTAKERKSYEISGAGYGIHWRDLDEDIGVEGILLGKKSLESEASFRRWLNKRRGSSPARNGRPTHKKYPSNRSTALKK
jgi:hypothetical protein